MRIKRALYIVPLLIIAALAFYWYEYRPSQISKKCQSENKEQLKQIYAGDTESSFKDVLAASESIYKFCLRKNGIIK